MPVRTQRALDERNRCSTLHEIVHDDCTCPHRYRAPFDPALLMMSLAPIAHHQKGQRDVIGERRHRHTRQQGRRPVARADQDLRTEWPDDLPDEAPGYL